MAAAKSTTKKDETAAPAEDAAVKQVEQAAKAEDAASKAAGNGASGDEALTRHAVPNPAPVRAPASAEEQAKDNDDEEALEYPRSASSEHYNGAVQIAPNGIALAQIAAPGWVGPVPFQIPEDRIDEVIELLQELKGKKSSK